MLKATVTVRQFAPNLPGAPILLVDIRMFFRVNRVYLPVIITGHDYRLPENNPKSELFRPHPRLYPANYVSSVACRGTYKRNARRLQLNKPPSASVVNSLVTENLTAQC